MEGVLWTTESFMELEEVSALIRERAASLVPDDTVSVHIFGSMLLDTTCADDLDVLIICDDSQMQQLREGLEDLLLPWPIDLTLMTLEEEESYAFLELVRSVQVYP